MTTLQANQLQAIYNELCTVKEFGEIINPIVLGGLSYVIFDVKGYSNFHFDFEGHVYINFAIYGFNDSTSGSGDKLHNIPTSLDRPSVYKDLCIDISNYNTMKLSIDGIYSGNHATIISNFYFD